MTDIEREATPAKVSPWNSLEVAKLVVSAAAALCVAALTGVLGYSNYMLAKTNSEAEQKYRADRDTRDSDARTRQAEAEKALRGEAAAREDKIRLDNEALAKAAADLAHARAQAAQAEALRREDALQLRAEQRASVVRSETREQTVQDRRIDHRFQLWSKLGPRVNTIYTYIVRVNDWKEHSPAAIVDFKRESDKIIFTDGHFYTPQFIDSYNDFFSEAFCTFTGRGEDAKIRGSGRGRKPDPINATAFTEESDLSPLREAYRRLMHALAVDLETVSSHVAYKELLTSADGPSTAPPAGAPPRRLACNGAASTAS